MRGRAWLVIALHFHRGNYLVHCVRQGTVLLLSIEANQE